MDKFGNDEEPVIIWGFLKIHKSARTMNVSNAIFSSAETGPNRPQLGFLSVHAILSFSWGSYMNGFMQSSSKLGIEKRQEKVLNSPETVPKSESFRNLWERSIFHIEITAPIFFEIHLSRGLWFCMKVLISFFQKLCYFSRKCKRSAASPLCWKSILL